MKWFGRKATREGQRPALARGGWGSCGDWPRSYEVQLREGYCQNPVAQRAVRMVAEAIGGLKATAAREIALAFGVPPMLLGLPGDAAYANYREANRALWRQAILPMAEHLLGGLAKGLAAWFPGGSLTLDAPPAAGVQIGNAVNFRGEPFLPGTDLLTRYPGA